MNEKTFKAVLATLLVVVALWSVTIALRSMLGGGGSGATSGVAGALESLDASAVTAFRVRSPEGETFELIPADGAWTVNGHPADTTAVLRVWGALDEASVDRVVATNPANHARMGIDAENGWQVTFETGSGATDLWLGETGRAYGSAYARLDGEDAVVLVEGDLRNSLARGLVAWRDKTVFTVDTARVHRISIERADGERIAILRGDSAWTIDGATVGEPVTTSFLREVFRLEASGFKADTTSTFDTNRRGLRVEAEDGSVLADIAFFGDGTTQHAVLPSIPTVYEVPNWKVERLTPTRDFALRDAGGG